MALSIESDFHAVMDRYTFMITFYFHHSTELTNETITGPTNFFL